MASQDTKTRTGQNPEAATPYGTLAVEAVRQNPHTANTIQLCEAVRELILKSDNFSPQCKRSIAGVLHKFLSAVHKTQENGNPLRPYSGPGELNLNKEDYVLEYISEIKRTFPDGKVPAELEGALEDASRTLVEEAWLRDTRANRRDTTEKATGLQGLTAGVRNVLVPWEIVKERLYSEDAADWPQWHDGLEERSFGKHKMQPGAIMVTGVPRDKLEDLVRRLPPECKPEWAKDNHDGTFVVPIAVQPGTDEDPGPPRLYGARAVVFSSDRKQVALLYEEGRGWHNAGGSWDPEDKTYEDTARREVNEELGKELGDSIEGVWECPGGLVFPQMYCADESRRCGPKKPATNRLFVMVGDSGKKLKPQSGEHKLNAQWFVVEAIPAPRKGDNDPEQIDIAKMPEDALSALKKMQGLALPLDLNPKTPSDVYDALRTLEKEFA